MITPRLIRDDVREVDGVAVPDALEAAAVTAGVHLDYVHQGADWWLVLAHDAAAEALVDEHAQAVADRQADVTAALAAMPRGGLSVVPSGWRDGHMLARFEAVAEPLGEMEVPHG